MQNVIDGRNTFLYWREVAKREPENAEAHYGLIIRYRMHDMPEEEAASRNALIAIPPEQNPYAAEILMDAIRERDVESAKRLIEAGVDVRGPDGRMFLMPAVGNGLEEVVRTLLDAGADAAPPTRGNRDTPLHAAAGGGHARIADILIDAGADVNARDARKQTPLSRAIAACSGETARLLIVRGAKASEDELAQIETMPRERLVAAVPGDGIIFLTAAPDGLLFWIRNFGETGILGSCDPRTGKMKVLQRGLAAPTAASARGGRVYFAESGTLEKNLTDGRILCLDPATSGTEVVLDGLQRLQDLYAGLRGEVTFVDLGGKGFRVRRLAPGGGEPAMLFEHMRLGTFAVDESGRTVAAVYDNDNDEEDRYTIFPVDLDGTELKTIARDVPPPHRMAFDAEGNCFLTTSGRRRGSSGIWVVPAAPPREAVPVRTGVRACDIALGPEGTIYYSTFDGDIRALEVDLAKVLEQAKKPGKK